ncbi:MAG: hypothetical protein NTX72_02185 [Candidatus Uhrbacteria bacterium]|nr:hypothetical protein [Candidatus Uhrbacteria bacterium]
MFLRCALMLFLLIPCACRRPVQGLLSHAHACESNTCLPTPEPQPPPPPATIKSKPTWATRTFNSWLQVTCPRDGSKCLPMGRTTILVEFVHNGCREFQHQIDNQSELIQGYAAEHNFLIVTAASDALTRALYDSDRVFEPPCRVFFYNDLPKADQQIPNEDQQFVELCKDDTSVTDGECRSQLNAKKLYAP